MNVLLVQPEFPCPDAERSAAKYWPWALLKIGGYLRAKGHNVQLIQGNKFHDLKFSPDEIWVTTVFSYHFHYVCESISAFRMLYPNATVRIGGVHASLCPDVYRKAFPDCEVHVGKIYEAERVEPAWDLLPGSIDEQIISFSESCKRSCSFCYCHIDDYKEYSFEEIAPKIRLNKVILNDYNLMGHSQIEDILTKLADFKVNNKVINNVEVQGGFDVRHLSRRPEIAPLFKRSRMKKVRLAWDHGMEMRPQVEACVEALVHAGYTTKEIHVYVLYNYDVPFEVSMQKIDCLQRWRVGVIHSKFTPITHLHNNYKPQCKMQTASDYYIHEKGGWTDKKIREFGSFATHANKFSLLRSLSSIDEVRAYCHKPSLAETMAMVMNAA